MVVAAEVRTSRWKNGRAHLHTQIPAESGWTGSFDRP
jgi:hypothetical protein